MNRLTQDALGRLLEAARASTPPDASDNYVLGQVQLICRYLGLESDDRVDARVFQAIRCPEIAISTAVGQVRRACDLAAAPGSGQVKGRGAARG